jgi:hypothetical protein
MISWCFRLAITTRSSGSARARDCANLVTELDPCRRPVKLVSDLLEALIDRRHLLAVRSLQLLVLFPATLIHDDHNPSYGGEHRPDDRRVLINALYEGPDYERNDAESGEPASDFAEASHCHGSVASSPDRSAYPRQLPREKDQTPVAAKLIGSWLIGETPSTASSRAPLGSSVRSASCSWHGSACRRPTARYSRRLVRRNGRSLISGWAQRSTGSCAQLGIERFPYPLGAGWIVRWVSGFRNFGSSSSMLATRSSPTSTRPHMRRSSHERPGMSGGMR